MSDDTSADRDIIPLVDDEVRRRISAVDLIDDPEIREETIKLTARAPRYFWEVPASTSGYHHPACRGEHGLWVHTLMVCTAIERLGDSYAERYSNVDLDHAIAAAILHDQRKNGDPEDPSDSSVSDHDIQMATVIADESELPIEIADAVAAHMGPWYDGPIPSTWLDQLVHNADMMASTSMATLAVRGPVPEELRDLDLQVIGDE